MNGVKPWMNATTNVAKVALTGCTVARVAIVALINIPIQVS